MTTSKPAYLQAHETGELSRKTDAALQMLSDCVVCPRECHVDRASGATGVCQTGRRAWVSSYNPHYGEEAPLVGRGGSGTIFFTHCNLRCNFCQNYDISHEGQGETVGARLLAQMMLALQTAGCHNINFVTPSHVVPQILEALPEAIQGGLKVPLVYNSSAYDQIATLRLLEGIVDIYMPDFKFWEAAIAETTCDASDYPEVACKALREMHRQVGDLVLDAGGVAQRGLLVRHLVLPQDAANTGRIMRFIAEEISPDTYVNVMSQYRPCGRASEVEVLNRPLTAAEYRTALQIARDAGLKRLDQRRRVFVLR
jgi:putative pyruvate formate lyase activating enzyme